MKKCSTYLGTREIQIKTTLRLHLIPVRMAIIKNTNKNKYWEECGIKEILIDCLWEYKLVQAIWKSVWSILRKLKIELPYDLIMLFLSILHKRIGVRIL
jgi:hypothetical protein